MKFFLKFLIFLLSCQAFCAEFAITMDDPMPIIDRDLQILNQLDQLKTKAALFVCGMRIDQPDGHALVKRWNDKGHMIANHSYSHLYFHSKKVSLDQYEKDFLKGENLIANLSQFKRFFRFPFLKEGDSKEKRDGMRKFLTDHGYKNGYVTIDASDWYIDSRMQTKLTREPNFDASKYRDYYLKHIWDRAIFYDDLAKKVLGRSIKHTLLIHHSALNARFLGDLIRFFQSKGWKLIDAKTAFSDPIANSRPNIFPAGESMVWAIAKQTGKYDDILRYPGEDGEYQKSEMDRLGL